MTYKRKTSLNDALILHMLMNGRPCKMQIIAERLEISYRTVARSIERLRDEFVIHASNNGVRLDGRHLYYGLKVYEPYD